MLNGVLASECRGEDGGPRLNFTNAPFDNRPGSGSSLDITLCLGSILRPLVFRKPLKGLVPSVHRWIHLKNAL